MFIFIVKICIAKIFTITNFNYIHFYKLVIFLSRVSMHSLQRAMLLHRVRLSVRYISKRMHLSSNFSHFLVGGITLVFLIPTAVTKFQREPLS